MSFHRDYLRARLQEKNVCCVCDNMTSEFESNVKFRSPEAKHDLNLE